MTLGAELALTDRGVVPICVLWNLCKLRPGNVCGSRADGRRTPIIESHSRKAVSALSE